MISVHFQGKPFNITIIQVYAPSLSPKEAKIEWFYEDLQDLLELTPNKQTNKQTDVLFIIGNWNAKEGSQEIPGVTAKFGLGVQNEAGKRLTEFFLREHSGHIKQSFPKTQDDSIHRHHQMVNTEIRFIILCSRRWRSSIQSAKTRPEAMAQIMSSLLQNSA